MQNYYQPEIETASREQIHQWQSERLVKQVKHVWQHVPFYRKRMEEAGVTPEDIQSADDLHKLPFLTKDRFEKLLSVRPFGKTTGRMCKDPVHQWNHRQKSGGFLYPARH